jgi:hypothetical protein
VTGFFFISCSIRPPCRRPFDTARGPSEAAHKNPPTWAGLLCARLRQPSVDG